MKTFCLEGGTPFGITLTTGNRGQTVANVYRNEDEQTRSHTQIDIPKYLKSKITCLVRRANADDLVDTLIEAMDAA